MSPDKNENQTDQSFLKTLALCRKAQMMKIRLQILGSKIAPIYEEPAHSPPATHTHTPASDSPTVNASHPDLSLSLEPTASSLSPRSPETENVGRVCGKRKADELTQMDKMVDGQEARPNLYQYLLSHHPNQTTTTSHAFYKTGKIPPRKSVEGDKGIQIRRIGSRRSFGRTSSITIRLSPTLLLKNERSDELTSAPLSCSPIAAAEAQFVTKPSEPLGPDNTNKSFISNSFQSFHPLPSPKSPLITPLDLAPSPCSPISVVSFPSSFASTKPATTPSPTSETKQTATTINSLLITPTPLSVDSGESVHHVGNPSGITSPSPTLAPRFQPPTGPTASWPDFGYLGSGAK